MIKKHEDFDKAIGNQEEKIESLTTYADQLMSSEHYAVNDIQAKKEEVLARWQDLKLALIEKRSKLGESQTLQQFSRDADEIENWMLEKLQLAEEESYKVSMSLFMTMSFVFLTKTLVFYRTQLTSSQSTRSTRLLKLNLLPMLKGSSQSFPWVKT